MFEFIRTHRRLMHFVLILFIVPSFALVGVESYTRFSDADNAVAKVAGQSITQQEFENAQRQQIARLQQMFGAQFDTRMLDTPEAKQGILDSLIAQRVLAAEAARNRLWVSDPVLQQTIRNNFSPANGEFDLDVYKELLARQGMTPLMYQEAVRQDLVLQQINSAVQASAFAPRTVASRLSDLNDQERQVQELLFKASDFTSQVKITDEMLKSYYDKNSKQFEIPEQVKAEYVVLNSDALANQITVSDADIKSYYDQNVKRYTEEEQRRASHILISVKKDASDADKAAAKAKAEALLAQLRKNPGDFARLAKENSQDPGSAEVGGDLGVVVKGGFPQPIEDTVLKLKHGEVSDLVQTEHGYHIVQVTDVKPAKVRSLDEVKDEIAAEIKKQQAAKKYSELREVFTDTVYEQSDSLKAVADKLNLKIETVSNVTRSPNPNVAPNAPYNHPQFLQALFSDDAIKNKRNTDAVEVAPNTLIAGRVVEHKPVTIRPFDEVKSIISERVTQTEAMNLAKKAGEAKLAEVKAKGDAAGFSDAKLVSRANSQAINNTAAIAVMKADVTKLPAYVGVELPEQGFGVYRINKVSQPATVDNARRQAGEQQITNALAQQEMLAYLEVLKKNAKVEVLKPITAQSDSSEEKDSGN
jgi:peptidyl-prolyl cis-trans isomerase D